MPSQQGLWAYNEHRPALAGEHSAENGQDSPVGVIEARPLDLAVHHSELVTEHEDLDILSRLRTEAEDDELEGATNRAVKEAQGHGWSSLVDAIAWGPTRASSEVRSADRVSGTHMPQRGHWTRTPRWRVYF